MTLHHSLTLQFTFYELTSHSWNTLFSSEYFPAREVSYPTIPFHPSLPMQFSRYQSLEQVHISYHHFNDFRDLYSLVGAFRALLYLFLEGFTWGTDVEILKPRIRPRFQRLEYVRIENCTSNALGSWCMVLSIEVTSYSY